MTDITEVIIERVAGEMSETYARASSGIVTSTLLRKMAEAAIYAAFQPLPMKDAPDDGSTVLLCCKHSKTWVFGRKQQGMGWSGAPGIRGFVGDSFFIGWLPIPKAEGRS